MVAYFEHFQIEMTKDQARSASHPGQCTADVAELLNHPKVKRQLAKIDPAAIAAELAEYGAWDAEELSSREDNEARIIWIAAGNICEEYKL